MDGLEVAMGKMTLGQVFEAQREGRDLSGVDLSHLKVRQLDLTGIKAVGAVLRGNRRPAEAQEDPQVWDRYADGYARTRWGQARMERADLTKADLTWALLNRGHLRAAVLRDAVLVEADLRGCDLRDADLRGADLTGAILDDVDLRGARWDDTTRWPEGFDPPAL
jgi:uncharacterized protein YjbI with pentapeptide repeats